MHKTLLNKVCCHLVGAPGMPGCFGVIENFGSAALPVITFKKKKKKFGPPWDRWSHKYSPYEENWYNKTHVMRTKSYLAPGVQLHFVGLHPSATTTIKIVFLPNCFKAFRG